MIQVRDLEMSHGNKTVLDGVSFVVMEREKIGIVGVNGTGKTTLLKILAGLLERDKGELHTGKERIGYLPQKTEASPGTTVKEHLYGGLDKKWEEYKFRDALKEVGLQKIKLDTEVENLSGGEKTRLGIARLLLNNPTALLLDEPTNNLDLEGLAWLEDFVRNFKGTVLVISHDRAFLDVTVEKIFELDPFKHNIVEYTGGYSDFVVERKARIERELATYERQEKKRKEMEEWIALKQQQLSIYVNPKVGRQLQAMKTRFNREIEKSDVEKPKEYKKVGIDSLGSGIHASKMIFTVKDMKCPGIVSSKEVLIHGSDRIQLKGVNGSGKSTFIKILMNVADNYTGEVRMGNDVKIGYFAQEHESLDDSKRVIDEFSDRTGMGDAMKIRKILGRYLFFGENVFAKVGNLSQGERVKLVVALLTHEDNDFLIFDEPTNHLDLESREVLERALIDYAGGFLVVSHDRYFIDRIEINRILEIADKEVRERHV